MSIRLTPNSRHIPTQDLLTFVMTHKGLSLEQINHLPDCDHCCEKWWQLKRQARKDNRTDRAA